MTRCTEKTRQGKRCKKHASHNGRCLLHISDMSTESTVEVNLPEIDWCGHMGCENWDKVCCSCADTRPHTKTYGKYIEGIGARDDIYCTICKDTDQSTTNLSNTYSQTITSLVDILSTLDRTTMIKR